MLECKVKVTSVDYCVEYEDVYDLVAEENPDVDEYSTEFEDLVDKKIEETKKDLPQKLDLTVEVEDESELDDAVVDAISDETNWLINSCEYDIVNKREIEDDGTTLFFEGDEGDLDAEEYARENNIEDYELEWDDYEKGYRMTFHQFNL